MDFVSDGLAYGRRVRCLDVVDDYTRECLAIEVDTSLPGLRVKQVLERLREMRGLPVSIMVDNGPEFTNKLPNAWAYEGALRYRSSGAASQWTTPKSRASTGDSATNV